MRILYFAPPPRERKRSSTEASPWNANHISSLGGGWALSRGWEVAGVECGCAILAAVGVLVGALGRHFDSLSTPAGDLVASSVIPAVQMGALGIFRSDPVATRTNRSFSCIQDSHMAPYGSCEVA